MSYSAIGCLPASFRADSLTRWLADSLARYSQNTLTFVWFPSLPSTSTVRSSS